MPDPIVRPIGVDDDGPEAAAVLADSVGLALLVVLERLEPTERLAFVLHDVFGMPFDEIASIVGRSVVAPRQLASRARRRVQGQTPPSATDRHEQRRVVDAFLAAAQQGNLEALLAVLDPGIMLRADGGARSGMSRVVRGGAAVAEQAAMLSKLGLTTKRARVNGDVGLVSFRPDGRVLSVLAFTVIGGRIAEIEILADPARLARLDLSAVQG